ncbi:Gamma-butyrobetaine dioxygenase (plasmid) [Burkholderia sp. AD24]|nr:Gamma-butyrobetaine dioxygenase [Burkholderia sp. AD24]
MNLSDKPRLLQVSDDGLLLATGPQTTRTVAAQTLRHACMCEICVDRHSGQRRVDVSSWPPTQTIASAELRDDGQLIVTFEEDGHRSLVPVVNVMGMRARRDDHARVLWSGDLAIREVAVSWQRIEDKAEQYALLDRLARYGFSVVDDCPREIGFVPQLARYIGRIKESRVGPVFDVRFEPSPSNLAFTGDELFLHTDNPYRNPVPGWQILHCIRSAAEGGESYVADGFACAVYLKRQFPDDYAVLTRTPVTFEFESKDASFASRRPVIALSDRDEVMQVSFNDRSMQPVEGSAPEVRRFYEAYRRYRALLADPARQVRFRLAPGQTFIVDNHRVLHARASFSTASPRLLQGAYVDTDWITSKYHVASRAMKGEPAHVA